MNRPERIASALTFTLVLGSSWIYLATSHTPEASRDDGHQPALYIQQAQWDVLDTNGKPEQRLQAARMERWAGESGLRLQQPRLVAWQGNGASWHATARRGKLHEESRHATLEDNVVVHRNRSAGSELLTLKTGLLHISTALDRIETSQPVTLRSGNWTFTADGLQANFDPDRIKLTGRVRGIQN